MVSNNLFLTGKFKFRSQLYRDCKIYILIKSFEHNRLIFYGLRTRKLNYPSKVTIYGINKCTTYTCNLESVNRSLIIDPKKVYRYTHWTIVKYCTWIIVILFSGLLHRSASKTWSEFHQVRCSKKKKKNNKSWPKTVCREFIWQYTNTKAI